MRWGRVEAIHPEDYSVDLVMTDDGSRLAGVQVLTPFASSNTGYNDMAQPSGGGDWSLTKSRDRDVLAGVAFFEQFPVVIGFRFPQICQMLFNELGRRINRHSSDVYTTTDAQGNTELYHPSGTYLRIGTSPDHEDLTGKDADGNWKITKNTGTAPHVKLVLANAGAPVATLHVDPSGNVTLEHDGDFLHKVGGTYTMESGGAATIKAPSVTNDTPQTTMTGNQSVTGIMNVDGEGGGGGATSTIKGSVQVIGGDVQADDISLKGHGHTEKGIGGRTSNSVP
ncbi:hypothetical protein [Bordetella phage vB_BbrM_PHB04]|uniref:Baseplate assembly protein n=1 Tax=Bordetella phage vB_BbrM_PHB04 TaxID=2029657 RepID=A0A291LA20_9CAUD|nr:hypothetical protein HOS14_gp006 [Bordetella phage vB_BbrM_PHB04]ATI15624.1 hypothetical protein [Bordetella phage vB_BbrM_PHB04]